MTPRAEPSLLPSSSTRFPKAALFASVAIYFATAVVIPLAFPSSFDLAINYSAAVVVRTGAGNIYDPSTLRTAHDRYIGASEIHDRLYRTTFSSYINPPTTAIALVPLSFLPFAAARVLFLLLNHALYLGAIRSWLRSLNAPLASPAGRVGLYCALLCSPIAMSFFLGQMDALIILLLMLGFTSALQGRDGRAGAWIGAAAAVKLSPILILGFFAARKRWSALSGAAIVLLCCVLVEAAVVGPHTLTYFATQVLPVVSKGSASIDNQSLLAWMYRIVTPRSALLSMDEMPDYPTVRFVWATVSIAIFMVTLFIASRATLDRPIVTAIALGVFIVVTVLVGAIAWDHYMTWAQLLVIAMAVDWFETRWMSRRLFWTLFSVGAALMMCPLIAQLVGTYGLLVFLAMAWTRLWRAGRSPSTEAGRAQAPTRASGSAPVLPVTERATTSLTPGMMHASRPWTS